MFFLIIGTAADLRGLQAPPTLHLKEGCPIILVANLSESLVNGAMGKLVRAEQDHVTVLLGSGNLVRIGRTKFTRFDPSTQHAVASRLQFPIVPAFALTFHKCQGGLCPIVAIVTCLM